MLVKCICTNCAGHLEFEEENAGEKIDCPHCGFETSLFLPGTEPAATPAGLWQKLKRRWSFVCAGLALLVLAGLGYSLWHWALPPLKDWLPYTQSTVLPAAVLVFGCLLLLLLVVLLAFPILIFLQLRNITRALWEIEANLRPVLPAFPSPTDEPSEAEKPNPFEAADLKESARSGVRGKATSGNPQAAM